MKSKEQNIKKSKWVKDAGFRLRNRKWLSYSSNIARRVLAALEDNNHLNQKKLASIIDVSPQYISKVLKGNENLSLETIAKLSEALKIELIKFPDYKYSRTEISTTYTSMALVYKEYSLTFMREPLNNKFHQDLISKSTDFAEISSEEVKNSWIPLLNTNINIEDTILDNSNFSILKQNVTNG